MSRRTIAALITLAFLPALPALAQPTVALHHSALSFECADIEEDPSFDCGNLVPGHPAPGAAGFRIAAVASCVPGISGVQFGIDYSSTMLEDGLLDSWTTCRPSTTIEFPGTNGGWPTSVSGVRISFDEGCVLPAGPDGIVPIGFFTVLEAPPTSGEMVIIPTDFAEGGEIFVVNCDDVEVDVAPKDRGSYAFWGPGGGRAPCGCPVPVDPTTWGRLKSRF